MYYTFKIVKTAGNEKEPDLCLGRLTTQEALEKVKGMFTFIKDYVKYNVESVDSDGTITIDFGLRNYKLVGHIKEN